MDGNEKNYVSISFNERISRIVLVIGTFSLFGFAFNHLLIFLRLSFTTFYINSRFPLGIEHLLTPFLLGGICIIIVMAVFYCCMEFLNFCNYNNINDKMYYKIKADEYYKRLIGVTAICLISSMIVLFVLEVCFIFNGAIQIIVICFCILVSIIALYKWLKKGKKFKNPRLFETFMIKVSLLIYIICSWGFLTIFFLFIGVTSLQNIGKSDAIFEFKNDNGLFLNVKFDNKVPDKVIIQSDTNKKDFIEIKKKDFFMACVETTKESINSKYDISPVTDQILYKQSFYEYYDKIDISKLLTEGKNSIVITFYINEVSKKSFKIVNEINNSNDKLDIYKDSIAVSLE